MFSCFSLSNTACIGLNLGFCVKSCLGGGFWSKGIIKPPHQMILLSATCSPVGEDPALQLCPTRPHLEVFSTPNSFTLHSQSFCFTPFFSNPTSFWGLMVNYPYSMAFGTIYSLILQIFTEHLLCARHCSRNQYISVSKIKIPGQLPLQQ